MQTVIVRASSLDEFKSAKPLISQVTKETPVNIHIELPWYMPVGKVADLAGMEFWAQKLLNAGMIVDDVSGTWYSIDIKGRADPIWFVALIVVVAGALIAFGVNVIKEIIISADVTEQAQVKAELVKFLVDSGYSFTEISGILEQPLKTAEVEAVSGGGVSTWLSAGTLIAVLAVGALILFRK